MPFALSDLRMNNTSSYIVSTIKQLVDVDDVLLSFITLNTKTYEAYELNSDLKNKSEGTVCYIFECLFFPSTITLNLHSVQKLSSPIV